MLRASTPPTHTERTSAMMTSSSSYDTLVRLQAGQGDERDSKVEKQMTPSTRELSRAVVRLQVGVLAIVFALVGGMTLFIMTVWLLIKGGSHVGAHLQLLNQFFIGYSVSWTGSIVGAFYGMLLGGVAGWTIGTVYNRIAELRSKP